MLSIFSYLVRIQDLWAKDLKFSRQLKAITVSRTTNDDNSLYNNHPTFRR